MKCKCGNSFFPAKYGKNALMCKSCVSNRRRFALKLKCVEYLGGKCIVCGYNSCVGALDFHHRDPKQKEFAISGRHCKSWEKIKQELDKCDLLCSNCHREHHYNEYINSRWFEEWINKPETKTEIECLECKKPFVSLLSSKRMYCSTTCAKTARQKIVWPPLPEIIQQIKNSSFRKTAENLFVTDNAIRKYLIRNGVNPKEIRSIKNNGK
jgi:hypothetical protein